MQEMCTMKRVLSGEKNKQKFSPWKPFANNLSFLFNIWI